VEASVVRPATLLPLPAGKQFIDALMVPAVLERLRREQGPTNPKAA
jgi:hypothetical protein